MRISIFEPFSKAFSRMTDDLFRNFDLKKWFVVGFTAFLANLLDYDGGNYTSGDYDFSDIDRWHWQDFWNYPADAWYWLLDHIFWFILGSFILMVIFTIIVVLLWLSSRGKFMFLHNVVQNKTEVTKPWRDYAQQGNSLFVFRLIFAFLCFMIFAVVIVVEFLVLFGVYQSYSAEGLFWLLLILFILSLIALGFFIAFLDMLINDFMVPVMLKLEVGAVAAMKEVIGLIKTKLGSFILYALFKLVLSIAVVVSIIFFGFFTCCVGFLLVIIPYISDVFLLPVSYTFRAYSIEFLEQFGDKYKLFIVEESV